MIARGLAGGGNAWRAGRVHSWVQSGRERSMAAVGSGGNASGAGGADALRHRAHADAIVQQAGAQLRALLHELAAAIDPFPEFPGSFFSYGIEVEPPADESERGCVVLGEDGELYELRIGVEADQLDTDDPATGRSEARLPLEELSPADYVAYAYRAVEAAAAYLEGGAGAKGGR